VIRDYPPAHIVHEAKCPAAPLGLFAFKATVLAAYPNSRPHTCISRETVTYNRLVVVEPVGYPRHAYEPSGATQPDATRPLCRTCRGTHPNREIDLLQWLGVKSR
jgi:hypothetical protein